MSHDTIAAVEDSASELLKHVEKLVEQNRKLHDRLDAARACAKSAFESHANLQQRLKVQHFGPHPADPDPYSLHGLSREHRQLYIDHYARTGECRP